MLDSAGLVGEVEPSELAMAFDGFGIVGVRSFFGGTEVSNQPPIYLGNPRLGWWRSQVDSFVARFVQHVRALIPFIFSTRSGSKILASIVQRKPISVIDVRTIDREYFTMQKQSFAAFGCRNASNDVKTLCPFIPSSTPFMDVLFCVVRLIHNGVLSLCKFQETTVNSVNFERNRVIKFRSYFVGVSALVAIKISNFVVNNFARLLANLAGACSNISRLSTTTVAETVGYILGMGHRSRVSSRLGNWFRVFQHSMPLAYHETAGA